MSRYDQSEEFVLDNSVSMAWAFEDESDAYTDKVLDSLASAKALVPAIWHLEVVNVLKNAEKRGRIKESDSIGFITLLDSLPICAIHDGSDTKMTELLSVARKHNLSSYDASYLILAMKKRIPIATKDKSLRDAAFNAGIHIWQTNVR